MAGRVVWNSYVEGPRWASLYDFVRQSILETSRYGDIRLDKIESNKGWFRETVYFTISGEEKLLESYQKSFLRTIEEFNK